MQEAEVRNRIEQLLRDYKYAVDARVCAQIDAGCCRTQRDWERSHRLEEAEEALLEKIENELVQMVRKGAA